MILSTNDLFLLAQCAISAAYQAGHIIASNKNRELDVQYKAGRTTLAAQVVTEVDLMSQTKVLEILEPTCERFDLALLSEESPDDRGRLDKDYFWCIDPLDGTLPFIESSPGYSVSIGLVSRDGISHIGVIYDPLNQVLYHAIRGQGCFRNGQPWHPEANAGRGSEGLRLTADRSFAEHAQFPDLVRALEAAYGSVEVIQHGGGAMNAMWVLDLAPALYVKFPRPDNRGGSLWDYAASSCIFEEYPSSAVAADIFGEKMELNNPETTFMNHNGILFASDRSIAQRAVEIHAMLKPEKT